MYKRFFGLKESPFSVNPDPRFLYQTREIQEALACLRYGVEHRKGFVLLTGEVGTGKTTLLNKLLEGLRETRITTAFIFNPRLGVNEFLSFALSEFGVPCESRLKSQILLKLNKWLLERFRCGETAALIVDEAQNLSLEVLEEIRLLTNLETATEKLLQIVLSGQPELENLISQPVLRQLRQRITLRCRMEPLSLDQTRSYIVQRLSIAGANNEPIFDEGATEAIFHYSRGIPRVINLLCEQSLITSYADGQKRILAETVHGVARDFELDRESATPSAPFSGGESASHWVGSLGSLAHLMDRMRKGN